MANASYVEGFSNPSSSFSHAAVDGLGVFEPVADGFGLCRRLPSHPNLCYLVVAVDAFVDGVDAVSMVESMLLMVHQDLAVK